MIYEFRIAMHKENEFDNILYYSKDGKITNNRHEAMVFSSQNDAEVFIINNFDILENIAESKGIDYKISIDKVEEHLLYGSDTLFYFIKEKFNGNLNREITKEEFDDKYYGVD